MSNISTELIQIESARYGKDVRASIVSAIREVDRVADTAKDSAVEMASKAAKMASQAENSANAAGNSASEAGTKAAESVSNAESAANSADTATTKAAEAKSSANLAAEKASVASSGANMARECSESAKDSAASALENANRAEQCATEASNNTATVSQKADLIMTYADNSKSYAVGGTGTRKGEDVDNAGYYYQKSKEIYNNFQSAGDVVGVKGNNEGVYRTGQVNLTAENVGAMAATQIAGVTVLGGIKTGFVGTGERYSVQVDNDGNAYVDLESNYMSEMFSDSDYYTDGSYDPYNLLGSGSAMDDLNICLGTVTGDLFNNTKIEVTLYRFYSQGEDSDRYCSVSAVATPSVARLVYDTSLSIVSNPNIVISQTDSDVIVEENVSFKMVDKKLYMTIPCSYKSHIETYNAFEYDYQIGIKYRYFEPDVKMAFTE